MAYVEQLVAERGLVPGDLLPTYAELAASVGVSLITVRRALDELERAGRVRRHQGLGTFLARPRILLTADDASILAATFSRLTEELAPAATSAARAGPARPAPGCAPHTPTASRTQ